MSTRKLIAILLSIIVAVVLIVGLMLAGSPQEQRVIRLDQERVDHLVQIANSIDSFYAQEDRLPTDLRELEASRYAYTTSITDPETGALYEYTTTGQSTYTLCATFDRETPSDDTERIPYPQNTFWAHEAGHDCFMLDSYRDTEPKPVNLIR